MTNEELKEMAEIGMKSTEVTLENGQKKNKLMTCHTICV